MCAGEWRAVGQGLGCAQVSGGRWGRGWDVRRYTLLFHSLTTLLCTYPDIPFPSHTWLYLLHHSYLFPHFCPFQFSVEVTRLMHDACEAIFDLGVPLPRQSVEALMAGIDASLVK